MEKNEKFLKKFDEIYDKAVPSKLRLSKKQIEEYNKGLSPRDFKISRGHTLEEYFEKYGKKLKKAKVLTYRNDELWLMNKRTKYWEIKNGSDSAYFAVPTRVENIMAPTLIAAAVAAVLLALSTGIYFGVRTIINSNNRNAMVGNVLSFNNIEPLVVTKISDGTDTLYFNRNGAWSDGAPYKECVYVSKDGNYYKLIENYELDYNHKISQGIYGIDLEKNEKLYIIRANQSSMLSPLFDNDSMSLDFRFELSGNLGALINGLQEIPTPISYHGEDALRIFKDVFKGCAGLTSVKKLVFPFTNFVKCVSTQDEKGNLYYKGNYKTFEGLFAECTNLIDTPILPSFGWVSGLADSMFYNCSSLMIGKKYTSLITTENVFYICTEANEQMFTGVNIDGSVGDADSEAAYSYYLK